MMMMMRKLHMHFRLVPKSMQVMLQGTLYCYKQKSEWCVRELSFNQSWYGILKALREYPHHWDVMNHRWQTVTNFQIYVFIFQSNQSNKLQLQSTCSPLMPTKYQNSTFTYLLNKKDKNSHYPCFSLSIWVHKYQMSSGQVQSSSCWFSVTEPVQQFHTINLHTLQLNLFQMKHKFAFAMRLLSVRLQ